jgi:hypothetical protein
VSRTGPIWGVGNRNRGGGGERILKGEYRANTVYTCM